MAVNSNFQIPTELEPGLGISEQVLKGIMTAHAILAQRQQLALQTQELAQKTSFESADIAVRNRVADLQAQGLPSEIALRQAETESRQQEIDLRNGFIKKMQTPASELNPSASAPSTAPSTAPTIPPALAARIGNSATSVGSSAAPMTSAAGAGAGAAGPSAPGLAAPAASAAPAGPAVPTVAPVKHSLGTLPANATQWDQELYERADQFGKMTADEQALYKGAIQSSRQNALMDPKNTMKPLEDAERQIMSERQATGRQKQSENYEDTHPKGLEQATSAAMAASLVYKQDPTPANKRAADDAEAQRKAAYQDKVNEAATQARAMAQATGRDEEAMIRTGVNPITKEKLTLDNAPDAMLVNAKGLPVPLNQQPLYKPTMNEKQTADTARQVLAISQELRAEVAKNPNIIGPLMGRDSKALATIGIGSQDAQRLLDDVTFLQSAATKMHTGRFSNEILKKMGSLIGPQMNIDQFHGGLDSIDAVANRYAKEDQLITVGEYKQMQAGAQGAGAGNQPAAPLAQNPYRK